jgi:MFS family permease
MPLLPVYATQVGATPLIAGFYLSFSYFTLAVGTIGAGWLSDRLQRRKLLLILGGVVMVPGLWLMGRATNIWQLAALTAIVWFCGGVQLTAIGVLTGLSADESERGKAFGIIAMSGALGMLIGGLATGPIADRWGYMTLFSTLSVFGILAPVSGALAREKPMERTALWADTAARDDRPALSRVFYLLVGASLTSAVAVQASNLGRSLSMSDLGLAAAAISSTGAIGGLVGLPLQPTAGWLSDRLGRKRFLIFGYVAGTGGLLVLAWAASLWHFWIAAALLTVAVSVESTVGQALVTDVVPPSLLGRGISLFTGSRWVGGVLGFAVAGYVIEALGLSRSYLVGAALCLFAAALILPIRPRTRGKRAGTTLAATESPDAT